MLRQNKSHIDIKSLLNKSKDDQVDDNFKAIYDKIEKASTLLRSWSSERK